MMRSGRSTEILVVAGDGAMREYLHNILGTIGYPPAVARTFQEGKDCMMTRSPALLIADVRLGDFNGLHLAWLRYLTDPKAVSIVAHVTFDRTLDAEARKLGAPYVVVPLETSRLVSLVESCLGRTRTAAALPTPAEILRAKRRSAPAQKFATPNHRKEAVCRNSIFQL
jgi:DNA-binding response OmpR family regulator